MRERTDIFDTLTLPETATLYVAGGVPQVFRRINRDDTADVTAELLYIPSADLTAQWDSRSDMSPGEFLAPRAGRFFEIDDQCVCPLLVGDRVAACLSQSCAEPFDRDVLTAALERAVVFEAHNRLGDEAVTTEFLARLMSRDIGGERFNGELLNLLTEQVADSLAVTYSETDGIYRLRLAVGDIAMWDKLDSALTNATIAAWSETIGDGWPFVPVGFLPEAPAFLDFVPTFLFVAFGIRSQRSRAIISMPVTGELSCHAARRLQTIARLAATVHERQFGVTEDLVNMFDALRQIGERRTTFDEVMIDVFRMFNRRTSVSRVVFIDPGGVSRSVVHHAFAEASVRRDETMPVAAGAVTAADEGHCLLPTVAEGGALTEDEAKRYYLDNVKSELCLTVPAGGGRRFCLAVGSPEPGLTLKAIERFAKGVASFLVVSCNAVRVPDVVARESASGSSPEAIERRLRRMHMTDRLTEGFFHSFIDQLSYLLGEAEVLQMKLDMETAATSRPKADQSGPATERVIAAIEDIVDQVRRLRNLCGCGDDEDEPKVRASRLVTELPSLFNGFSHYLQDTKNIAVRVIPAQGNSGGLELTRTEMLDYVYPLVVMLMDEAICSGTIVVKGDRIDGRAAIVLELDPGIIGHTNLGELVHRHAGAPADTESRDRRGSVTVGTMHWGYDCLTDGVHHAWMTRRAPVESVDEQRNRTFDAFRKED